MKDIECAQDRWPQQAEVELLGGMAVRELCRLPQPRKMHHGVDFGTRPPHLRHISHVEVDVALMTLQF